ncbi:MAG TPA: helix-turn-helix transcriptional regulator [Candidatus Hydrogenedentes bacterium]|nr:helix-turn-helix transcriptional regulator [Candidatus Hydrogenedentota bacterium]
MNHKIIISDAQKNMLCHIGQNVQVARMKQKLSIEQAALNIGCATNTLRKIELGNAKKLDLLLLQRIAKVVELNLYQTLYDATHL